MSTTKKILIGVCGGIAAYKIAYLVRMFKKSGAEVKIIITPTAKNFITPLTLSTLSQNEVHSEMMDSQNRTWINHVELALWADVMLIAPATASTLSKMAHALCDNLLLATYLSTKCPVFFAPAMDLDMWKHAATQENISKLQQFSQHFMIAPTQGELASGLIGEGRMAEPTFIFETIQQHFSENILAKNLHILVTAGPTFEALDPVRYIGNHSSGKMGFEIANAWAQKGANVTLVAGPVALNTPQNVHRINVQTAHEMYEACINEFPKTDITVMSAAVADYTPKHVAAQKIKKNEEIFQIELQKTKDILAQMGAQKRNNQLLIGFALETQNELKHAQEKLKRKNLDAIVLNSLNDNSAGFKKDTNKITIINQSLEATHYPTKSKKEVAEDICTYILNLKKR